jgi:hypothetical protein
MLLPPELPQAARLVIWVTLGAAVYPAVLFIGNRNILGELKSIVRDASSGLKEGKA